MLKRFFKKLIEKILSEGIDADVKINGTITASGDITYDPNMSI